MIEVITIIGLVLILIVVCVLFGIDNKMNVFRKRYSTKHVNEVSFQKYAKFYGYTIPKGEKFTKKIDKVLQLVNKQKEKSITKIAEAIKCDEEYTVTLLRYLKNKRLIDDKVIDLTKKEITNCTKEDSKLLEKYSPFIYNSHLQINEMIPLLKNKEKLDEDDLKEEIMKELIYLDRKMLLNGIRFNKIDEKIIYYSVEKKKIEKVGIEIVICPNCGSVTYKKLEDENVNCDYCHCKVEKKKENKKEK